MKKFYRICADIILWALLIWMFITIIGFFTSCDRKPRFDQFEEAPDLPADTVFVAGKVVNRCNYKYLSGNPKIARKQLITATRALDSLVLAYDHSLRQKSNTANSLYHRIQEHDQLIAELESDKAHKLKITESLFQNFKKRYEDFQDKD